MLLSITFSEPLLSLSNTSQLSYVFETDWKAAPYFASIKLPSCSYAVCPLSSRQAADHSSENNFFRITQSSLKVFSHCLVQSNKNEKRGIFRH